MKARDVSDHRIGYPPVTVKIKGFLGKTYEGTAVKAIPMSEMREIDDPQLAFLARPIPIEPYYDGEFILDGNKPLFPACREYLDRAAELMGEARKIAETVHANEPLTAPPAT